MVTNKKTHIIFRSVFLALSLVGCLASFGLFEWKYNSDFYLYFTNISNYLCFGVILTLLIDDIKKYRKGVKNEASSIAPNFRLSVCVMIFVTFLVYNTILNHPFKVSYWTNFKSVLLHLVCPVMYVVDYMLFSKHRDLRIYAPFLCAVMPLVYLLYILIRAEVYVGTGKMVYPYFFLNGYEIGWGIVALYVLGLAVIVIGIGYAFWAYDKLVRNNEGKLSWDFSPLPKPEPVVVENVEIEVKEDQALESEDKVKEVEPEKQASELVEEPEKKKRGRPRKNA